MLWYILNTFCERGASTYDNSNNNTYTIVSKSRSHLKILHSRIVTCSKSHTEGLQILGTTVQNLDSWIKYSPNDHLNMAKYKTKFRNATQRNRQQMPTRMWRHNFLITNTRTWRHNFVITNTRMWRYNFLITNTRMWRHNPVNLANCKSSKCDLMT